MNIKVDHYFHYADAETRAISAKLDQILALLTDVKLQGASMSAALDTLTQKVAETTTVEQSAIELLNGLSAQIASLKTDPAALQALADSLSTKSGELAAAVVANTPVV